MAGNRKRNPFGIFLIVIGVIALIGAGAWLAKNMAEDLSAEKASRQTVEELGRIIESNSVASTGEESEDGDDDTVEPTTDPKLMEMKTVEVDGIKYVGMLEIPSASLVLPVCYDWDYAKLAVSPCRYSGSYFTDDMVICAHDYGSHFRAIRSLNIGEVVFFTAMDGTKIKYIVSNVETVAPTEIDKMISNSVHDGTDNLWDLTLFTCNIGGRTRCAVRLEKEQ